MDKFVKETMQAIQTVLDILAETETEIAMRDVMSILAEYEETQPLTPWSYE